MSVVHNTSKPESVLRKKTISVCYHSVNESVAMGVSLVGHTPSKVNVIDLMKKVLYGHKRRYLVSNILYDIHVDHYLLVLANAECIQARLIQLVIASALRGLERYSLR